MYWYLCLFYSIAGIWAVLTLFLLGLIIYIKVTTGKCNSNVSLIGKTTIITGANTGIGYETALDFATRGAKVILACRDEKRGIEAVGRIINETNNTNVFFKQLDLSSLKSVKQFAEEVNTSEERLDILINNAGAFGLPPQKTEDGLLLLMQTNYFGPFLLTILLLNLMKSTPDSRIVNVSSVVADYFRSFDINNLNLFPEEWILKDFRLYGRTKLCNILFTIRLAEKLKNTSVTTYSLHPGAVFTEITRHQGMIAKAGSRIMARFFLKSPRSGAQTTIYCSIAKGIEHLSGEHFHDCHVVERYKLAQDHELPDKLWTKTENILNLSETEIDVNKKSK